MSSNQAAMIEAAQEADHAVQRLATAYARYTEAYANVARTAYGEHGRFRSADVTDPINVERLLGSLIGRMRSLGLQPLFERGRTQSEVGPEWVTALTNDIQRLVP